MLRLKINLFRRAAGNVAHTAIHVDMSSQTFGFRFSLSYALLMIGTGIQLPFLPMWLQAQGLSVAQITAVIAAMTATRVVGAPLFAALADYTGRRFLVIRGCAIGAVLSYGLLSQANSYAMIMGLGLLAALLFAPIFPLIEGFSVESASRLGLEYGRLRLWASLSFLVGSLASGALLTILPAQDTMLLITAAQMLSVAATFVLPPEPRHLPHPSQVTPLQVGAALKFLFASRFTVFVVAASLANCSHGLLYAVSSLHLARLGFDTFQIGMLWAAAVLAEVALFFFSGRLVKDVPLPRLLCIGLFGAAMRWLGMGFATEFYQVALLQMLHCISFATTHLSLMHFIRLHVPHNLRNTAQGLYTAFAAGLLLSSVTWISGPLYSRFGGEAFLFMAGLAALGLGVAWFNLVKLSPTTARGADALNPART